VKRYYKTTQIRPRCVSSEAANRRLASSSFISLVHVKTYQERRIEEAVAKVAVNSFIF